MAERSGGNPLFLLELVSAARDTDDIESLPDSVEAVIAARIDRLSVDDRRFLRRVSVLGRTTPLKLLDAVLDEVPGAGDSIWARLEQFVVRRCRGQPHVSPCPATRRCLQRSCRTACGANCTRVRDRLSESPRATEPDEYAETLSLHYFHAQAYQEAWTYSLVAAERARAVYANVEAAEFFERALAASRRLPGADGPAGGRSHRGARRRPRSGIGVPGAVTAYRAARRLVRDDRLADARLMLKLARAQGWLDRYSNALRWITRALHILDDAEEDLGSSANEPSSSPGTGGSAESRDITGAPSLGAAGPSPRPSRPATRRRWPTPSASWTGRSWNLARWRTRPTPSGPWHSWRSSATWTGRPGSSTRWRFTSTSGEVGTMRWTSTDAPRRWRAALGNVVHQGIIENNMAEIALDQGRVDEAEQLFESVGAHLPRRRAQLG